MASFCRGTLLRSAFGARTMLLRRGLVRHARSASRCRALSTHPHAVASAPGHKPSPLTLLQRESLGWGGGSGANGTLYWEDLDHSVLSTLFTSLRLPDDQPRLLQLLKVRTNCPACPTFLGSNKNGHPSARAPTGHPVIPPHPPATDPHKPTHSRTRTHRPTNSL